MCIHTGMIKKNNLGILKVVKVMFLKTCFELTAG